jgi:hypothetical protein
MRKTLFLLAALAAGCRGESLETSPDVLTYDAGVIVAESSSWLAHDYDVVLAPALANVPIEVHVDKPCCTHAEILKRDGRRVCVRLAGRYGPAESELGPRRWLATVGEAGEPAAATLLSEARIIPAIAFRDAPMMAGVRVAGKPATWTTTLELRLPASPSPLPVPAVTTGDNPRITLGAGSLRQENGLAVITYPVTAVFSPQAEGRHDQPGRVVVPDTDLELTFQFAWYETKGK